MLKYSNSAIARILRGAIKKWFTDQPLSDYVKDVSMTDRESTLVGDFYFS